MRSCGRVRLRGVREADEPKPWRDAATRVFSPPERSAMGGRVAAVAAVVVVVVVVVVMMVMVMVMNADNYGTIL